MRVDYDDIGGIWKTLNGDVPEIQVRHDEGDYYVWVASRQWLIRFFGGWSGGEQNLGVILTADGVEIKEIPSFVVPDFQGAPNEYKSRLGWVQGENDSALTMVVECPAVRNFRVRFDLDCELYQFLGYEVR